MKVAPQSAMLLLPSPALRPPPAERPNAALRSQRGPSTVRSGLLQPERAMQGARGALHLRFVDQAGDADLAGGDGDDVDPLSGKGAEHARGVPRVRRQAGANDADLGQVGCTG